MTCGVLTAYGQCSEFDKLLKKGDRYLKSGKPDYQEAINAYTAAIIACSGRANEAQERIAKMVNDMNKVKENAIRAENNAKESLKQDQEAEKKAVAEKEKAIAAEKKKEKILSNLKFTNNRAWVYKGGKFAIVDSLGNRFTDFIYTQPRQFNEKGNTIAALNQNEVLNQPPRQGVDAI